MAVSFDAAVPWHSIAAMVEVLVICERIKHNLEAMVHESES